MNNKKLSILARDMIPAESRAAAMHKLMGELYGDLFDVMSDEERAAMIAIGVILRRAVDIELDHPEWFQGKGNA